MQNIWYNISDEKEVIIYVFNIKTTSKHLSKKEFRNLKYLCHIAKNLKNQAIYNVRQHYFNNKKYLSYSENYKILKNSENYKKLNSNMATTNFKRSR